MAEQSHQKFEDTPNASTRFERGGQCPECNQFFTSPNNLLGHINQAHRPFAKPFACDASNCNARFARRYSLDRHSDQHYQSQIDSTGLISNPAPGSHIQPFIECSKSPIDNDEVDSLLKGSEARTTSPVGLQKTVNDLTTFRKMRIESTPLKANLVATRISPVQMFEYNELAANSLMVYMHKHRLRLHEDVQLRKIFTQMPASRFRQKQGNRYQGLGLAVAQQAAVSDQIEPHDHGIGHDGMTSHGSLDLETNHRDEANYIRALIFLIMEEIIMSILLKKWLKSCRWVCEQFSINNLLVLILTMITGAKDGTDKGGSPQLGFLIAVTLAVLWGVCWMFDIESDQPRAFPENNHAIDTTVNPAWITRAPLSTELEGLRWALESQLEEFSSEALLIPPSASPYGEASNVTEQEERNTGVHQHNTGHGDLGMGSQNSPSLHMHETIEILERSIEEWQSEPVSFDFPWSLQDDIMSSVSSASSTTTDDTCATSSEVARTQPRCSCHGKLFSSNSNLNRHYRRNGKRTHRCIVHDCLIGNRGFSRRDELMSHLRKHKSTDLALLVMDLNAIPLITDQVE